MKKRGSFLLKVLSLFLLIFILGGCKKEYTSGKVDKIVVLQGNNQCVLPGEKCKKDLKLELLGPTVKGIFGGKGYREPVSGVRVRFTPVKGSDLKFNPEVAVSGSGGEVTANIISGEKNGDQYFTVEPENSNKSLKLRVICGVGLKGANQEANSGDFLEKPVELKIVGQDGKPVKNADVYFKIASSPEKKNTAKCNPAETATDNNGIARTKVKIGSETGVYYINAEINDPEIGLQYRGIQIKELGINVVELIITVLGGLALFIFGMKLMSEGLQTIAGQKMKRILHFFTKNRFIAILAGIIVTGAIQSSSACTVMVVGFVNAGLLNLAQAIGVVFGANIGTTVTAQMISFNLKALALPAIILGAILMMCSKRATIKGTGQTIFGFGMLFFGMGLMGGELKMLSKFPSFVNFFSHFDCSPVNGYMPIGAVMGALAIGTAMTVLIQSSSATIGIAITLAMGGLINFYTAVPLILGDNIGTTITAILASLGANKRARQTAVAHLLFNIFGAFYMFILFFILYPGTDVPVFLYLVNAVTPGDVFAVQPENIARHIAMAHTLFNVFNVCLFMPFIPLIAKVCNMIIKIKDEGAITVRYLEPNLLKTPSIAIRQVAKVVSIMTQYAWIMLDSVINEGNLKKKIKSKLLEDVLKKEDEVDRMQAETTDYLVKLTREKLSLGQSDIIPLLMHCTNDAEHLADCAEEMISLSNRIKNVEKGFTKEALSELKVVWNILQKEYSVIEKFFNNEENVKISDAIKQGRKIEECAENFEKNHIKRLKKGNCSVQAGMVFVELLGIYVRISSRLVNIAERIPTIQKHFEKLN